MRVYGVSILPQHWQEDSIGMGRVMENKRRNLLKAFFLIGIIVCLIPVGQAYYLSLRHAAQQDTLRAMTQTKEAFKLPEMYVAESGGVLERVDPSELAGGGEEQDKDGAVQTEGGKTQGAGAAILEKYAALYEKNHDLAGWISIEGAGIDYPVMQCGNDEYYLHHDFFRDESKYGCLCVRGQADVENGTNFIIYGHNMKDGSMFGDLDRYMEKAFYEQNPMISFDTLYEERIYEIVAVFRSQVYQQTDDVFKYYEFYEADTEEAFDNFYSSIKELSLYDTGVEAAFGDTFVTLSTCAYHVEDGRFVVVARRLPGNRR